MEDGMHPRCFQEAGLAITLQAISKCVAINTRNDDIYTTPSLHYTVVYTKLSWTYAGVAFSLLSHLNVLSYSFAREEATSPSHVWHVVPASYHTFFHKGSHVLISLRGWVWRTYPPWVYHWTTCLDADGHHHLTYTFYTERHYTRP